MALLGATWVAAKCPGFNGFYNNVLDVWLTLFFTLEAMLKAMGSQGASHGFVGWINWCDKRLIIYNNNNN